MPHIFDLQTNQATELASPGINAIRASVSMETEVLPVANQQQGGGLEFGSNYVPVTLDLTGILRNEAIVIRSSIPPLPTRDGKANQQGSVTIQIDNTSRYMASLQDEAIIDGDSIQDSIVNIAATCGGMTPLPMYRGKVSEPPKEEEGATTFVTRSILWDIIDVPLVLERSESDTINPLLYVTTTTNIVPTVEGGVTYHHGIATWDQYGDVVTGVDNDGADKIFVKRIDFHVNEDGESVPLGKFTIKFISPNEYQVTQPNGVVHIGSPYANFNRGFLTIAASSWDIVPGEDISGTTIEFNSYYTARGNPWTICKHLIYKALTDSWGDGVQEPATLPVDWDAFTQFETAYPQEIFFSETNKGNEVFSSNVEDKPIRIKDILQKILDHVGCQLTFTPDGKISVVSTLYVTDRLNLRTYTSSNLSAGTTRGAAHSIFAAGPKFDRMVIRYGLNPATGDYGASKVELLDANNVDKFNTYEVALDYYKISRSDRFVNRLAGVLFPMVATSNRRLQLSYLPNWGLAIVPGDKFEVDLTTQPVLPNTRTNAGRYWMAYSVNTRIGGLVKVDAVEIAEPIEGGRLCESFTLCETQLC